jgi:hypothetical protein
MTLANRDIFYRDPTEAKIPNDGVAKIIRPETDERWDVLRWELKSGPTDECVRGRRGLGAGRAFG